MTSKFHIPSVNHQLILQNILHLRISEIVLLQVFQLWIVCELQLQCEKESDFIDQISLKLNFHHALNIPLQLIFDYQKIILQTQFHFYSKPLPILFYDYLTNFLHKYFLKHIHFFHALVLNHLKVSLHKNRHF